MADIVSLGELKAYLTVSGEVLPAADDAALTIILGGVVALFESATLRPPGFYTDTDERTEVRDGTGSARLFLDYPIAEDGLISVKLGFDSAAPSETLSVANRSVIVYGEGSRCITRVDGGKFGKVGQPRYIEVVYEHLGDLPDDAKLPIMEVAASVYRNRGSEGMQSETVGSFYSYTRDAAQTTAATNPNWQLAVVNNTPVVMA